MSEPRWFDLVLPWEEPRWFRGKRRWRRRHERIRQLESAVLDMPGGGYGSLPWEEYGW